MTDQAHASDTSHILQSLASNAAITLIKGVAAFFTGSGSMLAETIHSAADCGNQLLLLLGVKRSTLPPSPSHPLGYGRSLYFWSFLVALLLFSGGGVFSIYEGIHKILEPEPLRHTEWAIAILMVSLMIEGWALWGNLVEMKKRRGNASFLPYLRDTKDSDLIVVFGENLAAVLGLALAGGCLTVALLTGDGRWDALGSLLVGVVLVVISYWLAREVMSLLIGERASPQIEEAIVEIVRTHPQITGYRELITLQQGPSQVMVSLKVGFDPSLSAEELTRNIDAFEARLQFSRPEVRWCFVEPFLQKDPSGQREVFKASGAL
jgi:cation diffusion facilitator family transporter